MPKNKITLAETHKKAMVRDKTLKKGPHPFHADEEFITENERAKTKQQVENKKMLHKDQYLVPNYDPAYHPSRVAEIESGLKSRKGAIVSETSHFTSDRGRARFDDEKHSTAHENVLRDIQKRGTAQGTGKHGISIGASPSDLLEHKQAIKQHALLRENLQAIELMNDFTKYLKSLRVERADSPEAAQLKELVTKLVSHTKDFVTPHPKEPLRGKLTYAEYVTLTEGALKNFKKEMKHALTRKPHSIVEKVNDVIRKFLHIFDVLFSKVTGKPTAAETKTFGAKTLTGKDHFFNKPDSLFGKKVEAFHEAIKKAETPRNGTPRFPR